ncbi:hypothetical protein [Asanoa siamensis]|uniref:hypothetical protein n=1 Tax=Asanoa siamensis TaxID=926357 RepID=UPI001940AFB4|nr:hypothetical protein [Asanoa siamensis]
MVSGGAAAAADPPPTIYVDRRCGATADGSASRPYCWIGDAAAVAVPGQTVLVRAAIYPESVVVPSGEPGKPITFAADRRVGEGRPRVGGTDKPHLVISGAHDVVIDGFDLGPSVTGVTGQAQVVIDDASDVTISNGRLNGSIDVRRSQRVTVRGLSASGSRAPVFAIGAGTTDTALVGNSVTFYRQPEEGILPAISVADAPRTTVTNNTIVTDCHTGVAVSGASAGFGLHNSIVRTTLARNPGRCRADGQDPAGAVPVVVTGTATVDHNVLDPGHGGPLYSWAGTTYTNPGAFHAATGQGAHDIGADPKLANVDDGLNGWRLAGDSPAVDSAWAAAPGRPASDQLGNAHADKPDVPNSGGGYADRGAVELLPVPTVDASIARVPGGGALETVARGRLTFPWATDGPVSELAFVPTGGGRAVINQTGSAGFTFDRAGYVCVTVEFSEDRFRTTSSVKDKACVVVGGAYTAVTPQRVLDTRSALGVPGTAPIGPNAGIEFALPATAAAASAVVLNVTVTQPTTSGYLTVHGAADPLPTSSNLNFAAGQTVANLVTVKVSNGNVHIHNGGRGSAHMIADLAGYYGNTGSGLTAGNPARVLDTRAAVGVPGTTPIGPDGRVTVDLSTRVPTGTTAAVLNLTATDATNGGLFTAYPPGAAVPTASNLNFVGGQTVNNMVIAPVVDGRVAFAHTGKGTVHLIADLAAWFAPGSGGTLAPTAPTRILDTRATSTTLGPGEAVEVRPDTTLCASDGCFWRPRAVVANLTATGAQRGGYLTVYPDETNRPTQSVLNYAAGRTTATLFTTGLRVSGTFMVYNGGKGPVDVIVDQAGFYLAPADL